MLQSIRDKAQGWIAWVIVVLISIPFALWGIAEYLGVNNEPAVAQVAGQDITERELDRRARNYRESLRQRLGSAYRSELFNEQDLRNQMREQLIDERVLLDTAENWGLRTSDSSVISFIRSVPAFQTDGRFDKARYEAALRNQGMNGPMFETSVRQDMVMNQIRTAISNSAIVTKQALQDSVRLERQQRDVQYALIPAADFEGEIEVSDEALQSYYDQNKSRYLVQQEVSVQYIMLDVAELAAKVEVDEQSLRDYHESHSGEFSVPEQRKMRHILIDLPAAAGDEAGAEALGKITALKRRLDAGESFEDIAKAESADPGSASNGGDLGWVEPGTMVPEFDSAAFDLETGVVSEPVKTQFGYHLIEVTEVKAGGGGFDVVRDEVEQAYRRAEAENVFYDNGERLATLVYENAGSLSPAADNLELEIRTTEPFSQLRAPAELNSPKVLDAAFSQDVLENGNNSDVIELSPDQAVVLRVLEHIPEHFKPFEEVREALEKSYRGEKAAEATAAAGEAALEELDASTSTLKEFAQIKGWKMTEVGEIQRDASEIPRSVVSSAFALPAPAQDSVSRGGASVGNDYAVIVVKSVTDGDVTGLNEDEKSDFESRLSGELGRGELNDVLAGLRSATDVVLINTN